MRALLGLLLCAALAPADTIQDRLYVARITTERATRAGTVRTTLAAPALPVGPEGLLLAVGFAIDRPENNEEAVEVSVVDPAGRVLPARLLGGDEDLECTFFRLRRKEDHVDPVPLESAGAAVGDEVVLLARHGDLMGFQPRRITAHVDAVVSGPPALFALREPLERWSGAVATTKEGRLLGFVDLRDTITDGSGLMLGIGSKTLVIVAADAYKAAKWKEPTASRAWLGVNLAPFNPNREAYFDITEDWRGALVTGVSEGSPSAKAGLRIHDLIQTIGPLEITLEKDDDWTRMLRSVQRLPLGEPLPCKVVRFVRGDDGKYRPERHELTLVLEERPLDFADAPETEIEDLGLKVKPLTLDRRRTSKLPPSTTGVVVWRTARASPASLAGLRPLDLVLRIGEEQVRNPERFVALLDAARAAKRQKIVLFVRRGSETLFIPVRTGW